MELATKTLTSDTEELCMSGIYAMEITEDVEGTEQDPTQLLEDVKQHVCPSQCSNRGICENGTCACNEGTANVTLHIT